MWYTVKEGTHHVPFKPTGIGKVDYEGGTTSGAYMVDDEGEPLEGSSESEIGGFAQDITCRGNTDGTNGTITDDIAYQNFLLFRI